MAGNGLRTRNDVTRALADLFDPLRRCFSAGGARVVVDAGGASFDQAASELEGFARPLWGIAAAAAGGVDDASWWPAYVAGLRHGIDPAHPEHWGEAGALDQRIVELAAIAFALCVAPGRLWEPLDAATRAALLGYLGRVRRQPVYANNWQLFGVLIDVALDRLGGSTDPAAAAEAFAAIGGMYLGDGWYGDGEGGRVDHYNGFAFHTYGLIYARLAGGERAGVLRERATLFAGGFRHWFADDGAALPFGRSLTYRFACAAFWGACAFADVEALPWGVMKGLYLRHLRWWAEQPIARDGLLTVGYGYPNAGMAESYSSPQSPYWAFKAFLPLALPDDHPFWAAEEAPLPPAEPVVTIAPAGMLIAHEPGQTIALCAGQAHPGIRSGAEKYAKFAYSTRYGFSIESDHRRFEVGTFDSMLALADADGGWRVREASDEWRFEGDALVALWRPWPDVEIETRLRWAGRWHVRRHRIRSGRSLRTIEGGFCLPCPDDVAAASADAAIGRAWIATATDFSGIADLGPAHRDARIHLAEPNTNLIHTRTLVPQLATSLPAGETLLATGVLASPDVAGARAAWADTPSPAWEREGPARR